METKGKKKVQLIKEKADRGSKEIKRGIVG